MERTAARRRRLSALARAAAFAVLALSFASPLRAQAPASGDGAQGEEAFDPKPFRIRDIQAVRWQLDEVRGHIAGQRWSEAIDGLQALIEEHAADVLEGEIAQLPGGASATQPTHHGAAERARALLFTLPDAARDLYRARHEPEAQAALLHAWSALDRRTLWEVVRRYPLAPSAARAAWTLGDLAWERGEEVEAIAAWERALALALDGAELELTTPAAWQAALGRVRERASLAASLPAIERRAQAASEWLARRDQDGARATARPRPPSRDSDRWFEPVVLPSHPFTQANRPSLAAARSDDGLFVSTSLRVVALDTYTGGVRWRGEEPRGWAEISGRNEFFKGIDIAQNTIAPAASPRAVVAALQIPVAFIKNADFQREIGITTQIPDRRLFAFDPETGRELWNHLPPPDWDGDSGDFVERMSIAGPPVIVGTRVLAPCYRIQGRIHYAVACFDLETGALLWSTDVISGQRELNMFGRHEREFCAPSLVVDGERVIALTQLGALACLDLYSGEVRWVTLYDQMPLLRNRDFGAPPRAAPWRNQPPVIAGSTIVATPYDSWDLIGVDLASGKLLWSLSNKKGAAIAILSQGRVDQLVGARNDLVYLAGDRVIALRAPGGLASGPPNKSAWVFSSAAIDRDGGRARALLSEDRIVVPTDEVCLSVDLQSGHAVDEGLPWGDGMDEGNVLLGERELFAVSNRRVCGYFDWGVLVQRARARLVDAPNDPGAGLALARLLANRGATEVSRGRSREARTALLEARQVLETLAPRTEGAAQAELSSELHRTLRALSRVQHDLAEPQEALASLRRARTLAPSAEELRDTLLEELRLERDGTLATSPRGDEVGRSDAPGRRAEREAIYAALESCCAALPILCDSEPPSSEIENGSGDADPAEARFAFDPLVGATAREDLAPLELPLSLWALFAREREAIRARDSSREFELLHRILAEFADVPLVDVSAGELAHARIGELVSSGRTAGHEPFVRRAEEEYRAAEAAHDRARLVELARRYPFSPAARRANDARLDWAADGGDLAEVARILQAELGLRMTRDALDARGIELCVRLAETARRAGNTELADEMLRHLATLAPDARVTGSDGAPHTIAELARGIARAPLRVALPPPEPGRFTSETRSLLAPPIAGEHEIVARGIPDDPALPGALVLGLTAPIVSPRRASALVAYAPGALDRPLWRAEIASPGGPLEVTIPGGASPWTRHVAVSKGRVLVAREDGVVAFDERSGEVAWSWALGGPSPRAMTIAAQSGVLVLSTLCDDGGAYLHALDARTGALLWETGPQSNELVPDPLLSSHAVISVPLTSRSRVLARDLFTGREIANFELAFPASQRMRDEAWIEEDRLVVPRLRESAQSKSNRIVSYDLNTGRVAWSLSIDEIAPDRRQLQQILQHHEKTYLVLGAAPGPNRASTQSGLYELSTSIGAVAPVHSIRLAPEDLIIGARGAARVRLAQSKLLVLSRSVNSDEARVRAIDLEGGELWSQPLGERWGSLAYVALLPAPVWSDSSVAFLVWSANNREARARASAYVAFLDAQSGVKRETYRIDKTDNDGPSDFSLYPLEEALVIRGPSRTEFLR